LGLIRLQQGRFADAVPLFRRAIRIDKNSAEAHHHLGVALTGSGRLEDAIERFEKALTIRPDLAEAHDSLGHALQLLGRHQAAVAHHERALAIKPTYAEAHNNLGNALHRLGQSEKAVAHYEKALAIRPNYAEAHNNLGHALVVLGRHQEAIAHYKSALAIQPEYVDAHINLGNALGAIGIRGEAVTQYERALTISPSHVEVRNCLSELLLILGRPEEAIAHCEKVLAIRPTYADAHVNLGIALGAVGRNEEAITHYKKALTISPNYIGTLNNRRNALIALLALVDLAPPAGSIDVLGQLDRLVRDGGEDQAEFENLAAFARVTVLDKAARHAEAWNHALRANRTIFLASQKEFSQMTAREHRTLIRLRERSAKVRAAIGGGQTISLFILGPSRSGKTTMEKLISTLEGVKRGYENPIVEKTVRRVSDAAGLPSNTFFEHLPERLHPSCHDIYNDELAQRAGSSTVFTNTNPIRIHDADLVAGTFPNVRFLFVKRNLEDNVLRIYMRKYRVENIYAYDLKAARDHVVWYHQMMDLLAEKLPAIVRVIHYEDLIADPATTLRTAADLCGLHMANGPLPALGDDRGCAAPYRRFIAAELESQDGT
jgi:tetratricopeptide (TPR) repeat protein